MGTEKGGTQDSRLTLLTLPAAIKLVVFVSGLLEAHAREIVDGLGDDGGIDCAGVGVVGIEAHNRCSAKRSPTACVSSDQPMPRPIKVIPVPCWSSFGPTQSREMVPESTFVSARFRS